MADFDFDFDFSFDFDSNNNKESKREYLAKIKYNEILCKKAKSKKKLIKYKK